jgi:hypothetical protein
VFPVPTTAAVSTAIINLQVLFHEYKAIPPVKLECLKQNRFLIFVVIHFFMHEHVERGAMCESTLNYSPHSEILTTVYSKVNGYVITQICNYRGYLSSLFLAWQLSWELYYIGSVSAWGVYSLFFTCSLTYLYITEDS